MRCKIDENLPVEVAETLAAAGHDATTVLAQNMGGQHDRLVGDVCRREGRVLLTLDLDFADIRIYRPQDYSGLIVLRLETQDKPHILDVVNRIIPLLA